eukprot:COSAG01_NODE_1868_length_9028_cov_3.001232_9_plen_216_part_00
MGGWGGGGGGGSNLHAAGLALVAQQRLQQLVDRARLRSSAPYGYNKQPHHLTPSSSSHTAEDAAAADGRPVCSTMRSHAPLPFATRRQRAVSRSATCKRRLLSFCAPTQRATQACQSWAVCVSSVERHGGDREGERGLCRACRTSACCSFPWACSCREETSRSSASSASACTACSAASARPCAALPAHARRRHKLSVSHHTRPALPSSPYMHAFT